MSKKAAVGGLSYDISHDWHFAVNDTTVNEVTFDSTPEATVVVTFQKKDGSTLTTTLSYSDTPEGATVVAAVQLWLEGRVKALAETAGTDIDDLVTLSGVVRDYYVSQDSLIDFLDDVIVADRRAEDLRLQTIATNLVASGIYVLVAEVEVTANSGNSAQYVGVPTYQTIAKTIEELG